MNHRQISDKVINAFRDTAKKVQSIQSQTKGLTTKHKDGDQIPNNSYSDGEKGLPSKRRRLEFPDLQPSLDHTNEKL